MAVGEPRARAQYGRSANALIFYVRSETVCQMFRPETPQNGRTITMTTITTISSVGASLASL